jgi:pyruvate kinase
LPILALSASTKTLDELKLVWGVDPILCEYTKTKTIDVKKVLTTLKELGKVQIGDKVVMIHGEIWGEKGLTSVVRIQEVV